MSTDIRDANVLRAAAEVLRRRSTKPKSISLAVISGALERTADRVMADYQNRAMDTARAMVGDDAP